MRWRTVSISLALALVGIGSTLLIHRDSSVVDDVSSIEALGNKVFADTRLSGDGRTSCAICHQPQRAFSDGRPVAIGLNHLSGTRNTPSLTTMIASRRPLFFWDGRRGHLEEAVLDPFTNPVEMGLHERSDLSSKVSELKDYRRWFADTSDDHEGVNRRIADALAAYLRSLNPEPTRFELFVNGNLNAIGAREKIGKSIFEGKGQCATCHKSAGARLTDDEFHRSGVSTDDIASRLPSLTKGILDRALSGGAIGDRVATQADESQLGRFNVSHDVRDLETFATPSLREVRLTAPYMHDGSVGTLDDAIDREVYYRGLETGYPVGLTAQERSDLKAFLETL